MRRLVTVWRNVPSVARGDDAQRRAGEQRRVAVREVEHAAHQLARLAAHQHAAVAIGDEIERDAQLARGQLRFRTRQFVDAIR